MGRERSREGFDVEAFRRYACKMATGSGKSHRHGDALRVEHPEQDRVARGCPLVRSRVGLSESDHPRDGWANSTRGKATRLSTGSSISSHPTWCRNFAAAQY